MALNWDLSKCAAKDDVLADTPDGYRVTECIIFSLMDVGMRGLPDEAAAELFVERTAQIAKARGGTMMQQLVDGQITDRAYTLDEVKLRIGLTTNVSPMSKTAFNGKLVRVLKEHA